MPVPFRGGDGHFFACEDDRAGGDGDWFRKLLIINYFPMQKMPIIDNQ